MRASHHVGRLIGVEVVAGIGELQAIVGRNPMGPLAWPRLASRENSAGSACSVLDVVPAPRRGFVRRFLAWSILIAGTMSAPACLLARGGPVNTGPGSIEDIRHRLSGDWELVSLTTSARSGVPVRWDVAGQLTYDEFGNWRVHVERHAGQRREVVLDFSGQAVIDPARHIIRFDNVERRADSAGSLPPILGPEHPHRYAFTRRGGLTTNVLDDDGRDVATLVWRRGRLRSRESRLFNGPGRALGFCLLTLAVADVSA